MRIATIFLAFLLSASRAFPSSLEIPLANKNGAITSWTEKEIGTAAEAEKFIELQSQALLAFLEPSIDPYTGRDVTPELCQKKNLPPIKKIKTESQIAWIHALYSSSPQTPGQCPNLSTLQKTQLLYLYCKKSKKLFTVKHLYPQTTPWLTTQTATCPK